MTARSVRLQLSEGEARALHNAVEEAIAAKLLPEKHRDAARTVLDRLGKRVPSWLERSPVGGEAGYLMAADAVLRVLVEAEGRGRDALADVELAYALADAKPAGVTIDHVLRRMEREKLVRAVRSRDAGSTWFTAARAGRQRLASSRDGAAHSAEWAVDDVDGLLELIFREHRPGREAYRPFVQAIGRLSDERFEALADELRVAGLLEGAPQDGRPNALILTNRGAQLAEDRIRATLPPHAYLWRLPAPPLPYIRGLPLLATREDRECTCRHGHAAWLQKSSRTRLHATIRQIGVARNGNAAGVALGGSSTSSDTRETAAPRTRSPERRRTSVRFGDGDSGPTKRQARQRTSARMPTSRAQHRHDDHSAPFLPASRM